MRELDRAGPRVHGGEAQVVLIRVQEQPRGGEHHRHVVARLGRQLVEDRRVPEVARAVLRQARHAAFAAVVRTERELEAVVQRAQLLVEIRDVRARGRSRIEPRVEARRVATEPVARPRVVHELQRPARARARHGVHLRAGFLREDAEQQRLGQPGLFVRGPHAAAHELVVLVRLEQVRAQPGEPLLERRLHGRVHGDHLAQVAALEQRDGARGLRQHAGGAVRRRARLGSRVAGDGRIVARVALEQRARLALEQRVLREQHAFDLATGRGHAAARGRRQQLARARQCGRGVAAVAVAHALQRGIGIASRAVHVGVDRVDHGFVHLAAARGTGFRRGLGAAGEQHGEGHEDGTQHGQRHSGAKTPPR